MNNIQIDDKPILKQKSFRKVIVLNIGTMLMLIVSIIFLSRVGFLGEEIQKIRNEQLTLTQESDIAFLKTELVNYEDKIANLENILIEENDVVPFITEINRLEQQGIITNFDISGNAIDDGNGNKGFPFSVVMTGTEEQVDAALRTLQSLPFLIRGIVSEVRTEEASGSGESIIIFNYGGVIYVNQN